VDERLYNGSKFPQQRPHKLRRDDLPELTRALIAVVRKRGKTFPIRIRNVGAVRIQAEGKDFIVLKEDWDKIEPLILDDVFDPTALPARQAAQYLFYRVAYNEPVLDWADVPLYFRILGQLKLIFTETFPTSDL
jgi:hypothetical protein